MTDTTANIIFNLISREFEFVAQNGKKYSSENGTYVKRQFLQSYGREAEVIVPGLTAEEIARAAVLTQSQNQATHGSTPAQMTFSVRTRFNILRRNVTMIAKGLQNGVVIAGEGGIGKTHNTMKTLRDLGLIQIQEGTAKAGEFIKISGYSTPKAMYADLFYNRFGTIVFDDCDSVLKDDNSVNLLKAALDTSDDRVVSWKSMGLNDDLPSFFKFEGRVIFITNRSIDALPQAIKSRSNVIDMKMTNSEKIDLMEDFVIDPEFLPEVNLECKIRALDTIKEVSGMIKNLTLRSLIKAAKTAVLYSGEEYRETAVYALVHE